MMAFHLMLCKNKVLKQQKGDKQILLTVCCYTYNGDLLEDRFSLHETI